MHFFAPTTIPWGCTVIITILLLRKRRHSQVKPLFHGCGFRQGWSQDSHFGGSGCRVGTLNHYTENFYPSQNSFGENLIHCVYPCEFQAPWAFSLPPTWWLSPGLLRAAPISRTRSGLLHILGVVVRAGSLKWFSCVRSILEQLSELNWKSVRKKFYTSLRPSPAAWLEEVVRSEDLGGWPLLGPISWDSEGNCSCCGPGGTANSAQASSPKTSLIQ